LLHCELSATEGRINTIDGLTNCSAADPLRLLNQPKVIAEVIGGILLGPTVMMRIPGFQESMSRPTPSPNVVYSIPG